MRKVLYIFSDLTDSDIEWLAGKARRLELASGDRLVEEGAVLTEVFIVLEGELSVVTRARPDRPIATLYSGEIVGELSFLDSRPPSASVVARSRAVVLGVPRDALHTKLSGDPTFASHFYRALGVFLASRLRRTMESMGYADDTSLADDVSSPDEIDPELMESIALAARRFEVLLDRFRL